MKLPSKRLRVVPNPFAADLSADGRACAVVPVDMDGDGGEPGRLVGVALKSDVVAEAPEGNIRGNRFRRVYLYLGVSNDELEPGALVTELAGKDPVVLPNTQYYRERIAEGALIAADIATANACGISKAEFVEPDVLLEKDAKARIEAFNTNVYEGADGYAHFCEERKGKARQVKLSKLRDKTIAAGKKFDEPETDEAADALIAADEVAEKNAKEDSAPKQSLKQREQLGEPISPAFNSDV